MRFEFEETRPDFGGTLTVHAETPAEVATVASVFNTHKTDTPEGMIAYAQALQAGTLTVRREPRENTNQSGMYPNREVWYCVESSLDEMWTRPYEEALKYKTGYDGQLPHGLDVTDCFERCQHTYLIDRIWIEHGHFSFKAFDSVNEPWNKLEGHALAEYRILDHLCEDLGTRDYEREFIPTAGGLYKPNPRYATGYRNKPKPMASKTAITAKLFHWWLDNHANEAQKLAVSQWEALRKAFPRSMSKNIADESTLYCLDPNGRVDWDGKGTKVRALRWDQFRAL